MTATLTLACGICTYWIMKSVFPATGAWILVFVSWFLLLSTIRTVSRVRLRWVPPLWIAVPLLLIAYLVGSAIGGPLVGSWIPVCCVVGTASAVGRRPTGTDIGWIGRFAAGLAVAAGLTLLTTGALAVQRDSQRSHAERVLSLQYNVVFRPELRRLETGSSHPCEEAQDVLVGLQKYYLSNYVFESLERVCSQADFDNFLVDVASGARRVTRAEVQASATQYLERRREVTDRPRVPSAP